MSIKPRFDSMILACVIDDLQSLIGGQIQRLNVSDDGQTILSVYRPNLGEKHWLLDISASWARTHLTHRAPPKTRQPLAFESALRKYVLDGTIRQISQAGFDRIISVDIEGAHGNVRLIGEFTGHRSNLILCDAEQTILHAAKLITHRQNRHREILIGRKYTPPPQRAKFQLHQIESLSPPREKVLFSDWLKSTFEGMSPLLEREILFRADDDLVVGVESVADKMQRWEPIIYDDENSDPALVYPFPLRHLKSTFTPQNSIHEALEIVYREAIPKVLLSQQKSTFAGVINKALKQNKHALRQVQNGLSESDKAARYRRFGEMIYAQLHAVKAGEKSVILQDYYDGGEIVVPLREDLSPTENAARYFERAKHSEARLGDLQARAQQLENEQLELAELHEKLQEIASLAELNSLRQTPAAQRLLRQPAQSAQDKKPQSAQFDGYRVKVLTSPDGYEIFVGENATSNDYLVRHVMKTNDWWLHLRGATSAHAVIRTGNNPQKVPQSTLLFAAREVIKRSAAKHSGYAAVDYTLGKYVRKPRKSPPGSVDYQREKTLHLTKE